MELIKIVNARKVLDSLSDRENVGAHLSYWMTKFVVKTESDHEFYASEMRKLFEKYATKKEGDEDTLLIAADKVAEFNDAVEALNKTDAEDPGIRFNLSELSAELKLSMKQMYPLLDFIDEEK
ncbi:MAG: hypothetical protein IKA01_04745 [Alistipes sp.]|nr:hypothetical protein [Alistipes sp.]